MTGKWNEKDLRRARAVDFRLNKSRQGEARDTDVAHAAQSSSAASRLVPDLPLVGPPCSLVIPEYVHSSMPQAPNQNSTVIISELSDGQCNRNRNGGRQPHEGQDVPPHLVDGFDAAGEQHGRAGGRVG